LFWQLGGLPAVSFAVSDLGGFLFLIISITSGTYGLLPDDGSLKESKPVNIFGQTLRLKCKHGSFPCILQHEGSRMLADIW